MEPGPLTGALLNEKMNDIIHVDVLDGSLNQAFWAGEVVQADTHERADYLMMVAAQSNYQPKLHESRTEPILGWRLGAIGDRAIKAIGESGTRAAAAALA